MATRKPAAKKTQAKTDEGKTPAELGRTSTTPPVPGTSEDCAYCGHPHYKVDKDAETRGHFQMPCPDCNCELRAGTA